MKYRGIEPSFRASNAEFGRGPLRYELIDNGQCPNRPAAVAAAERAIKKVLTPIGRRLRPLDDEDV